MAENSGALIELAAEVVAAYVSNNSVPKGELAGLIDSVHAALAGAAGASRQTVEAAAPPTPAVSIKKSVTPDYLICLEDGGRFKSLKRHLQSHYGMTPEAYRAKWKLPADYPMVAPAYAAKRSALAKSMGLGRKRSAPKKRVSKAA